MIKIADYENCKIAILDTLKDKGKSKRGNKISIRRKKCMRAQVRKIKAHLARKAWRLKNVLESEAYKPPKFKEFYIYDGSNHKRRHITVPDLHSQFVHHAIFNVLGKTIERRNYFYDCGNMPKKGQALAIKQVKALFKDKHNKYYAQFDVSKYYDSVPHKPLIWLVRNRVTKDKAALKLLWKIIQSSGKCGRGMAIGFYSSQYLAVLYLQGLDYKITQDFAPACGYVRYVDDGVIVGSNKRVLQKAIIKIAEYLKTAELKIKGVWEVRKIDKRLMLFLGYRFGRGVTILSKGNMLKIARAARYAMGRVPTPHRAAQLISHWGQLKACDSYNFRLAHFDKFVSINKCKEVISNDYKRRQRAKCGV